MGQVHLCHLSGAPQTQVHQVLSHQAMEQRKNMGAQKQQQVAHLRGRPSHLLKFPDISRMLRHYTPHKTHMFRLWKIWPWSPAVSSCTEDLTHSLPINQMHGSDSSVNLVSSKNTQTCTIVSFMDSMLASLAYNKHIFLLITPLLLSTKRVSERKIHQAVLTGQTQDPHWPLPIFTPFPGSQTRQTREISCCPQFLTPSHIRPKPYT